MKLRHNRPFMERERQRESEREHERERRRSRTVRADLYPFGNDGL